MISSVKENILKYTHMLNTTADRTSGNKVDTELLRILAELFFVSQEVSEMLAARLKMIIKIDDLECFCIKCQVSRIPFKLNLQLNTIFSNQAIRNASSRQFAEKIKHQSRRIDVGNVFCPENVCKPDIEVFGRGS